MRERSQRNQEARAKFEAERRRLQEAQRINENIGSLLRDMDPRLGNIEADRMKLIACEQHTHTLSHEYIPPTWYIPYLENLLRACSAKRFM